MFRWLSGPKLPDVPIENILNENRDEQQKLKTVIERRTGEKFEDILSILPRAERAQEAH